MGRVGASHKEFSDLHYLRVLLNHSSRSPDPYSVGAITQKGQEQSAQKDLLIFPEKHKCEVICEHLEPLHLLSSVAQ